MKTPTRLYDYRLPREMIAQEPAGERDSSRLLVVERGAGTLTHRRFGDIAGYLREGDLLVVNDTRVFPARLFFKKETGARIEFLFVHPVDTADESAWIALAKPGKRLKEGIKLSLEKNPGISIEVEGKDAEEGTYSVRFHPPAPRLRGGRLRGVFERYGAVPLPPYIEKPLADIDRYQTIYSNADGGTCGVTCGSTAAPTAGLHFTPELMEKLKGIGCRIASVTLHIGYATFRPIRTEFAEDHPMHAEWYSVPDETAAAINRTRKNGGRVVAVGTTSVRTLESWAKTAPLPSRGGGETCGVTHGSAGAWTNLYITEGFPFRAVDVLVTNFHLPKSTLIVLTAAFCGRELLLRAYGEAIKNGYRFYSLGDAMLIL
ncbi:MAG: tRNA preQ1(34) S-adenosylmethionine ribosyltransferase-isomerase QueA [bacterium]